MIDLSFADAGEMAHLIRQRKLSSEELVRAHLDRIGRYNGILNAVVTVDEEGALPRARESDQALARGDYRGALHGVPVVIKDCLETKGIRTTAGFPPLASYVPDRDATVVARLRAAGAVILGKTNVPPLAGDYTTDNPIFGRANNPWDLARTPGGSTGGGAAAVSAGLAPLDVGSDVAGSVRVPAHNCGVYGITPTDHRVPLTGHIPELPDAPRSVRHMNVLGPLARSVDDLDLVLGLIAGPDGQDWEVPPVPFEPAGARPANAFRIAWTDEFGGVPVTADTSNALLDLAIELERRGCHVECCGPDEIDFVELWETYGELSQAESGPSMPEDRESEKEDVAQATLDPEDPISRGRARAFGATMRQYADVLTRRDRFISLLERFLAGWDALICPVAVGPAMPHDRAEQPTSVSGTRVPHQMAEGAYAVPFNLTGNPVAVVPAALSAEGLPIGVQVVGRRWGEAGLLEVARLVAEVAGPFRRPPGYSG